jgi:plasmid maintenance system killer protein
MWLDKANIYIIIYHIGYFLIDIYYLICYIAIRRSLKRGRDLNWYFKNKKLEELYLNGKCSKYKLEKRIIKKFMMSVKKIDVAKNIYDLQTPANLFEKLKGYESRYSIRMNDTYRLEFEIEWDDKEKGIVEIIGIEELSKHYE